MLKNAYANTTAPTTMVRPAAARTSFSLKTAARMSSPLTVSPETDWP